MTDPGETWVLPEGPHLFKHRVQVSTCDPRAMGCRWYSSGHLGRGRGVTGGSCQAHAGGCLVSDSAFLHAINRIPT